MGLALLVLGVALFVAAHLLVRARAWRAALIGRCGKPLYRTLFALTVLAALALIAIGFSRYRAEEWVVLWQPPRGMSHLALALMLPAAILLFAAFLPGHIAARTRYPALLAVKIWAFAHLTANGDLGSLVLFGGILAWAVMARVALKRNPDPAPALPAAAPGGWSNDAVAVGVGILVYLAVVFVFHPVVIGVPVLGA